MTVHKSQGTTLTRAILDISSVFESGQAYVALSRVQSIDGLWLERPVRMNNILSKQSSTWHYSTIPYNTGSSRFPFREVCNSLELFSFLPRTALRQFIVLGEDEDDFVTNSLEPFSSFTIYNS
eukprot:scaffold38397_cov298-Amphora_coffeaeformis.AAC.1